MTNGRSIRAAAIFVATGDSQDAARPTQPNSNDSKRGMGWRFPGQYT
jgi:hypothetical protein